MIITVVAVAMVQPTLEQVICMVAVGYKLVAATIMAASASNWRTFAGIGCANFNHMLVVMAFMGSVQVAIMQIVNMVAMLYTGVSAMLGVGVCVGLVGFVAHSFIPFYLFIICATTHMI